jgi:hypothetical protein
LLQCLLQFLLMFPLGLGHFNVIYRSAPRTHSHAVFCSIWIFHFSRVQIISKATSSQIPPYVLFSITNQVSHPYKPDFRRYIFETSCSIILHSVSIFLKCPIPFRILSFFVVVTSTILRTLPYYPHIYFPTCCSVIENIYIIYDTIVPE